MHRQDTRIKVIAMIGTAAAVAAFGVSSSSAAAAKPKPICASKLVSLGAQGDGHGLQLSRRTLCGRSTGPAFG